MTVDDLHRELPDYKKSSISTAVSARDFRDRIQNRRRNGSRLNEYRYVDTIPVVDQSPTEPAVEETNHEHDVHEPVLLDQHLRPRR